jgi:energy-coupling factor transporter ATP-binding protein EcfA2
MQGRVEICGLDTRSHSLHTLATMVNMVFQDPDIGFFCSTVEDEIAFGPRNLGLSDEEVQQRVEFALESTCIQRLRTRRVVDLSGGEKQRVAIASVLSMKPRILVLDEPTSDLDPGGVRSTVEVLQSLRTRYGMTVVVAEHRFVDLSRYLNRVVVMEKGRIIADGSCDDIFNGQRRLLSELGILPPHEEVPFRSPIINHTGCSGLCELKKDIRSRDTILRVNDVAFNYPHGQQVLRDISFEIGRGELVALLGANGTGKTTLAHLISGLLKPCRGEILLNGVGKLNGNLARRVGLLFQNPSRQLFCDSVREEAEFGPRNMKCSDFARRAQDMLEFFGLERYADGDPHHLSEGEKQRLATASILATSPNLLILDEPTTGQDWGHLKTLMDMLRVHVSRGMSVLLITHDVHLAMEYASRAMIMREGAIVADGPVGQVLPYQTEFEVMPLITDGPKA